MLASAATPIGQTGASRAAGQDDVALAGPDEAQRIVERDDRRGAGGDLGHDRAGQAPLHRQHRRAHRARQRRHRERRHEARALAVVDVGPVDDLLDPAAAGVDDDADPVALLLASSPRSRCPQSATASLPAAIAKWMKRLIRRAIFGSMNVARVEVEDLGRDPDLERRRVEALDQARPGHARDEVRPVGREVVADRHDGAEAGDDGAPGTDRVQARRYLVGLEPGCSDRLLRRPRRLDGSVSRRRSA